MNNLYLDDIRIPTTSGQSIVRSYKEAIEYMEEHGCPDFISFDHDLGDREEQTGLDVVKWMITQDLDNDGKFIPKDFKFNVHSANPPGAANIEGLLTGYLEQR